MHIRFLGPYHNVLCFLYFYFFAKRLLYKCMCAPKNMITRTVETTNDIIFSTMGFCFNSMG